MLFRSEDSLAGTLAAHRAHCHVVAVPGPATKHHEFPHADLRLASMADADLPELMQQFAG